jgi:hypothetical protein
MYKNFNITESEKEQILNRLKENGYGQPTNKKVISEQPEDELEQNPIGELRNDFHIISKDEKDKYGILYLLRNKRSGEYGVFNKSMMDWQPGYQPSFKESDINLYETQKGDSVIIEKYTGIDDKVFYTLYKVENDSTIRTVKFLNTREHSDVIERLKPVDTDESVNNGGFDEKYTDKVYEEDEMMENPLNEGKQVLVNTFKKLIK